MKTVVGLLSAFALVFGNAAALAQETEPASVPKMEQKVFVDMKESKWPRTPSGRERKVRVSLDRFESCALSRGANFNVSTPMTEKRTAQYKTGEVNALEAGPVYILKNAGDTELVLYIVYINR
jgi:hypothetical protein